MVKFEDDSNNEGITEPRRVSARYVILVPAATAAATGSSYTNGGSGTGSKRASPVQQLSPPSSNSSNHSAYGEYEDTTGMQQQCSSECASFHCVAHMSMQLLLLS
jgi:hypothetical protein